MGGFRVSLAAQFVGLRAIDVLHLYHGTRQNRQYVERYGIFHENAYDPVRDVEIDPETGLLQWSAAARERKPDLVRLVAEYFERRREDE